MRKIVLNKWFLLAFLLLVSLSAFSIVAYQKAHGLDRDMEECCQRPQAPENRNGDRIFDAVSRQFISLVSIP